MPNLTLLWTLALIIAAIYVSFSVVPIVNAKGDAILTGLVNGVPVPRQSRLLLLWTHYVPLVGFMATFNLVFGLGFLELARGIDQPSVAALAYMTAIMAGSSAVVWVGMAPMWIGHILSAVRQAEAEAG